MEEVKRPRILLLGNGILQAFGGESWMDFLGSINSAGLTKAELESNDCPAPLKAILATGDHVDVEMKKKCSTLLAQPLQSEELATMLQEILSMGFDHILTTNYTYELEQAAVYPKRLSRYGVGKMVVCSGDRRSDKRLLHTRNCVTWEGVKNQIWHIHGEVRNPSSTVLGHYYYGNLLCGIREIASDCRPSTFQIAPQDFDSWVRVFLCADIYCLGFGYDVSEFDLWWLLNRKARENDNYGKLYFYEPASKEGDSSKLKLMRILKQTTTGNSLVEILHIGYQLADDIDKTAFFQSFYHLALEDIKKKAFQS